ncbi:dCTP deaminase [Candidatus Beckwithbacteria bacterium CG10_big_fil_rev_8_21_14_0_10_34_10]|uniref:dCTP deaminase n=1 Tax=Candidatus Beckwithbacteria bacterium CG10_big_fil_rev_8_21_14_0_10_34_10 TaxID=1974495 RepID=A0A2H0W9K8_9BACT|nr:MAG: dCTP deaminase [Candidatus Beckwithbacteria bacterium CG10_big_fil_rev_8_21_14_0_10_34_10]
MALSDIDIKKALAEKRIKIKPSINLSSQLGSCSIDLRLSNHFLVFNHAQVPFIDPKDKEVLSQLTHEIKIAPQKSFIIQPGEFVLASTIESIILGDDILARLEGRSSLGRLGIVVHSTASVFDPGWDGKVVLELGNLGKMAVALAPGIRICSLTFENLSSKAQVPYNKKKNAKYLGQQGPIIS